MKTIFKGLLFVVTLVALAYAGVLLEKKKINAMVEFPEVTRIEHRVDTIVVFKDGRVLECKLGSMDGTEKEIRKAHNILKLIMGHVFDRYFETGK